jgi:hypothetical protein
MTTRQLSRLFHAAAEAAGWNLFARVSVGTPVVVVR